MALSQAGAGLASPFTSFRVLVSRSPRMYDISASTTGRRRNREGKPARRWQDLVCSF
jgi:hypothetical protein